MLELRLYDVANTAGVAADLSHINTAVKVSAYTGQEQLGDALRGCQLVVIPAGVPRKPGMTRDDLFNINAGEIYSLHYIFILYLIARFGIERVSSHDSVWFGSCIDL